MIPLLNQTKPNQTKANQTKTNKTKTNNKTTTKKKPENKRKKNMFQLMTRRQVRNIMIQGEKLNPSRPPEDSEGGISYESKEVGK